MTICSYGLLLMLPVIVSLLVVSVLQLGLLTFLVPFATFLAATYFLPLGFGNPHVVRLARSVTPPQAQSGCFLAQLTLVPRLRSGWRAVLDDADDIGWVCITGSTMEFRGDSIRLTVPLDQVREVARRSIGIRGLYLYPQVAVKFSGLPQVNEVWLAERSSWLLPTARRITGELCRKLEQATQGKGPVGESGKAAR